MDNKASDERAVEAAYDAYITRFPEALWQWLQDDQPIDYGALDFWTFPMLFIAGAEGAGGSATQIAIQTLEEYDRGVRTIYRGFHDAGWRGDIELDVGTATRIAPRMAMINTRGTRYFPDGSVLNTWNAVYMYRRIDDAWKQIAVADVEQSRPSAAQWQSWLTPLVDALG